MLIVWALTSSQAFAQVQPISVTPETLPPGKVGVAYNQTFTVSGGVSGGPYYSTFIASSDQIPGLCCYVNNAGGLSGTPTQAGTYVLRYTFGERAWLDGVPGAQPSIPKTYAIVIEEADPIEIAPVTLPDGQAGQPYSAQLTASGGLGPYSFSIVSGGTPIGMTINSAGALGGTPIQAGTFTVNFRATDSLGETAERSYTFEIAPPPPVVVSPPTLPNGQVGQSYTQTLGASGGARGPYQFSIVSGSLPVGTFSSAGVMSGTALVAGTYTFRIRATDDVGVSGERDYTVVISEGPPVEITPAALPDGKVGQFYDQTLIASGGSGSPYTIALVGVPAMPPGLSYAGGRFSGTATAAGAYPFTIRATDSAGNFTERDYSIVIAPTSPVELAPASVPVGQIGQPYIQTFTASGGVGAPYRYFVIIGNLPDGVDMTLDGTLSGTPTESGSFPFTVDVFDAADNRATRQYALVIDAAPPPTAPSLSASVIAGETVTLALTPGATGGPFSDATVMSSTPAEAGVATLTGAPDYALSFASQPGFSGTAVVTYTLTGPGGVSHPATVTIVVTARPDPSADPEVAGLLNGQTQAAKRFAAGQIENINQRMGALHGETCRDAFASTVRLSGDGEDGEAASVTLPNGAACHNAGVNGGVGFWAGGGVDLGHSSPEDSADRDLVSVNLTAGLDYRFSNRFVAGLGVGYASDEGDIGVNGTESSGEAYSATLYASYRPSEHLFIDALAGYGAFSFDSRRFVTGVGGYAKGQRDGEQLFGSLTTGYDHRTGGLLLTPFARLTASSSRLDAFTENGAGIYSLAFGEQDVDSLGGSIGLSGSYEMPVAAGLFTPRFRLEYTHEFSGSSDVDILYADVPAGTIYGFQTQPFAQDQIMIGLGADLQLHNQMTIGFDYRGTVGFEDSYSHAFGLKVGGKF